MWYYVKNLKVFDDEPTKGIKLIDKNKTVQNEPVEDKDTREEKIEAK